MTQKFCGSEGAVAASAMPSDFFHDCFLLSIGAALTFSSLL
jgi:hypothetical protein